jgi:hypothetical protein
MRKKHNDVEQIIFFDKLPKIYLFQRICFVIQKSLLTQFIVVSIFRSCVIIFFFLNKLESKIS